MSALLFRLKAAQRDLIERCGGIMRVVEKSGYSKSEVGRWNNAGEPDLMPLSAIVTLEADCGLPLVTCVLAEANGRRLTDPEEERRAESCVIARHADVMRNAAELAQSVALAIADGQVTPAEASGVDRMASALEKSVSDLRAAAAAIKARGGDKAQLHVVGGEG
ncbi:hypothetical protein [Rhizobium oryzicola]|uniref:XRE family transcriptional regulator n=1 Tax=Rhizobium oryzicola TaxID=1232668 RepID=A0ABT8SVE3_9HYPH|nr:hypothetical protein [Rhizobium oryzicola]MDO1582407.1 hypothetical protein [Rhizobium oryzicola]